MRLALAALFVLLAACSDDGSQDFTKREVTIELDVDPVTAVKQRREAAERAKVEAMIQAQVAAERAAAGRSAALQDAKLADLRNRVAALEARAQQLAASLEITRDAAEREALSRELIRLHVEVAEARAELARASAAPAPARGTGGRHLCPPDAPIC